MPIHPSPMPSSALASAISEPPPRVAEQHDRFGAAPLTISSYAVLTSTMHDSCRQSVSLFM